MGGGGGGGGRRGNSLPFTTLADWFDFWGGWGGGGRKGGAGVTLHIRLHTANLTTYHWCTICHHSSRSEKNTCSRITQHSPQHPLIQNGKHWSCQHVLRSFEVRETVKTLPLVIAEHQALLLYPPFARGTLDSPKPPPPAPSLSLSHRLTTNTCIM